MITKENFTRINNDVNGNPRYVIRYADLYTDAQWVSAFKKDKVLGISVNTTLEHLYEGALKIARKTIRGKKYNTKEHPRKIVIQSYNLDNEVNALNKALDESEQATEQTK